MKFFKLLIGFDDHRQLLLDCRTCAPGMAKYASSSEASV
jgi:hypothetical protein